MSTIEICMFVLIGLVGLCALLLIWTLSKLYSVATDVDLIWGKLVRVDMTADHIAKFVRFTDRTVDLIWDEVRCVDRDDEDEEEEEGHLCGKNIEVVVVDELVEDEDEEEEEEEDELDIHLITPEMYYFANGYSKNELKYYPNTDQVKYFFTDNTCLAMEDIPEYIGDGLMFFGMNVQEPDVVYVRNHILNADFRIKKVEVKNND